MADFATQAFLEAEEVTIGGAGIISSRENNGRTLEVITAPIPFHHPHDGVSIIVTHFFYLCLLDSHVISVSTRGALSRLKDSLLVDFQILLKVWYIHFLEQGHAEGHCVLCLFGKAGPVTEL